MALPLTGKISLNDIVTEFGGTAPHSLSEYIRGGFYVRDTTRNNKIPTNISTPNKFSYYYGATKYIGGTTIVVSPETKSQYANKNDGTVTVTVAGTSASFTVTCTGNSPVIMSSGQSHTFGLYDSTASVSVIIVDEAGTHNCGPFTIGYNSPSTTHNYTF